MNEVRKLEVIFVKHNKTELFFYPNFIEFHLKKAESINLPIAVKKIFFTCRLYFRIRHLNKNFEKLENVKNREIIKTIT